MRAQLLKQGAGNTRQEALTAMQKQAFKMSYGGTTRGSKKIHFGNKGGEEDTDGLHRIASVENEIKLLKTLVEKQIEIYARFHHEIKGQQ